MDVVNYFYQDGKVLYTTGSDANKAFNILGAGDNIIATEHQDTNGNPSYSFYNKDLRGSTTNILGSDLTSEVSYNYDWFGNTEISNPQGSDFYNPICYTGGMYDESTKQYYLNARYYDPEDGRFISQDTYRGNLRDANSWNLYAYCANNPVKYSDPSGHIIQVLFAVGFAAWAVYDGVKEYKKAKKAGKTGSKLALHMGGYIAKDIIIGKALKALKVGEKAVDIAKKVYKSKVVTKTFAAVNTKIQPRLPKLNVSNTSKLKVGSEISSKTSSKVLRKNMINSGVCIPDYANAAHHIVAGNSPKAAEARAILQKYGVDINDATNGVFLPTVKNVSESAYHTNMHTNAYYSEINKQLLKATSKEDVLSILDDISEQLMDGRFMK